MLSPVPSSQPETAAPASQAADFMTLLKPKVMSLVVFSGFAGYWIAPGREALHPFLGLAGLFCLALGAGASGAFNMWYDRDIDAVMNRTRNRPLPLGRVQPDDALGFAVFMTILAVMMMGLATNWTAAALLAFASFFYVVIYTIWLKRRSAQNIVIGGASGAFPPMIGWAMVTGDITVHSLILFALIFFWTPPHFWALALFANEDYKRANIPMLPVIAGEKHTKWQMLAYTLLLVPLSVAPVWLGMAGWIYGGTALALSLFFVFSAVRVLQDQTHKAAKMMFGYSVFYLFALFLALMMDHT